MSTGFVLAQFRLQDVQTKQTQPLLSVKNLQRNYDYVSPEENLGGRMYSFKLNWD